MSTAGAGIDDLAERFFELSCRRSPFGASSMGVAGFDHLVPDVSLEADDRFRGELAGLVAEAQAIDDTELNTTQSTTRLMLIGQANDEIASIDDRTIEYAAGTLDGPQARILQSLPNSDASTEEKADAYLTKLSSVVGFMDAATTRLRGGLLSGRSPVAQLIEASVEQLDTYLAMQDDPLLTPVRGQAVEGRAAKIVVNDIRPAMAALRETYSRVLLPEARGNDLPGVCHLPQGERTYASALRHHSTTDLTAEQIHQIGLEVVAALDDEYASVGQRALGVSDPSLVRRQLREDASLRFETRDQVLDVAVEATARATAALPSVFGLLPTHDCDVLVTPDIEAPTSTLGYYRPPAGDGSRAGAYYINTWEPQTRTRYEAEALAFHEGVPGHHLQITISQAIEGLPKFRAFGYVTAHAEGWALYTERLADEMGLYSSEVSRLGMLSFDSWRACRLVVDTGIHARGWSRDQAIDYLAENTALSMDNVRNEIDRYIAWPGQACAYMIGRREIVRLRAEAEVRLGAAFDLKSFHDRVLDQGAVPLDVLARTIEGWALA
ncbi:MAG: hypothetical protein ACI867_000712 [Glaciecola sp.]